MSKFDNGCYVQSRADDLFSEIFAPGEDVRARENAKFLSWRILTSLQVDPGTHVG
jgi:hypothetical protein